MIYKMNNMDELKDYEVELAEILESNIARKEIYVARLQNHYSDHAQEIKELYETWQDLNSIEVPQLRTEMDDSFYRMMDALPEASTIEQQSPKKDPVIVRWLTPSRMAVAATFFIGLMAGQLFNFGSTKADVAEQQYAEQPAQNEYVKFASIVETPSALKRIKGINQVKTQNNPDLKIIDALNKVILFDPNINVRLTAIETMVYFSHIPEARTYLIEAIPFQDSPIVQLELADITIALEEDRSADQWIELLD